MTYRPVAFTVESLLRDVAARLNAPPGMSRILATGYPSLDRVIWGLEPGKVYLVVGGPASGKTAFAFQMADELAQHTSVIYATATEEPLHLLRRALALRGLVTFDQVLPLLAGSQEAPDQQRLRAALEQYQQMPQAKNLLIVDATHADEMCALERLKETVTQHLQQRRVSGGAECFPVLFVDELSVFAYRDTWQRYQQQRAIVRSPESLPPWPGRQERDIVYLDSLVQLARKASLAVVVLLADPQVGECFRQGASKEGLLVASEEVWTLAYDVDCVAAIGPARDRQGQIQCDHHGNIEWWVSLLKVRHSACPPSPLRFIYLPKYARFDDPVV